MKDKYRFLFLMDPYETLNLETETSLLLIEALLHRGHSVFWIEDLTLSLSGSKVYGEVSEVTQVFPFKKNRPKDIWLEYFDAFLLRKDPPFDEHYLHLTLILDFLPDALVQFNSIAALRSFNEKLLPLRWPALTPPTLVTASAGQLLSFFKIYKRVILKPVNDCSGRGIERLTMSDSAEQEIRYYLEHLTTASPIVMMQKFLPEVSAGDKRVYLVHGEAIGWVNRVPQAGSYLANIHQGARCETTTLTNFEKKAVGIISPILINNGIFFAGLDFIGDNLTEINITSPSAIRQINEVMNCQLEVRLVDAMLETLGAEQVF